MKTILTVVFVTSIFTLFVRSATAMPQNDPAFYEAQDALQPWFQLIRQRIFRSLADSDWLMAAQKRLFRVIVI